MAGLESDEAHRKARDILLPGGEPLGRRGSKEEIRNVAGGLGAAEDRFEELASLGRRVDEPRYSGEAVELPVIGRVE